MDPMAFLPKLKRWISKCCVRISSLFDTKANVALDPDTRRHWLFPSEDQRKVRYGDKQVEVVSNPERFSYHQCVPGHEGFRAGRHFWEVTVENADGWSFAVVSKAELIKGRFISRHRLRHVRYVMLDKGEYMTHGFHAYTALSLSEKPKRMRMTLDYEGGYLSFSDVDSGAELRTYPDNSFSGETLLPVISVWGHVANFTLSWGD